MAKQYMEAKFKDATDKEILIESLTTPKYVLESKIYKDRFFLPSNSMKSSMLILSNIHETLKQLKKTQEGRKQAKLILAAVSHPLFGIPELTTKVHSRDIKEAKEIKQKFREIQEPSVKIWESSRGRSSRPGQV